MVKARDYSIFLLVIFNLISLCGVSCIEAESLNLQIPVIQSTSPLYLPQNYFTFQDYFIPLVQSGHFGQTSQPGNNLFCSESSWSSNPVVEGLRAAQSLNVSGLPTGGGNTWWSKGVPSNPPLSYSNSYGFTTVPPFSALPSFNIAVNQTIDFSSNPFSNPYGGYSLYMPSIFGSPVDHLYLGRTLFLNGHYESAITELKSAINLPSVKEEVCLLLGMSYQALGSQYLKEAEKYLKQAAGFQLYSSSARLQLANVYYQQGEYSKAIQEYGQVVNQDPNSRDAVKGLALSYFKANDLTPAIKKLQQAETMDPNDIEVLCTMGFILQEKHLFAEARQYYARVIEIAPDSSWASQARDHVQDIDMVGDASSIEDLKDQEVSMLIMSAPDHEDMPDNALVVLLDEVKYQLLPDDTLINKTHRLFKILDERGKDASEIKLPYDSTFQSINIDLARVIKPDGTITGISKQDIQEVTPWLNFPSYNNNKVLIISMPGVTVGSIIEYQVTVEEIPGSKLFGHREIEGGFALASSNPVKRARIEVSVPADREFKSTFVNTKPLQPVVVTDGEMKHFTWNLSDIPAMITEPMMPPVLDVSPLLLISSIPSWGDIADWWRGLEAEAVVPDDAIRSTANLLTQNLSSQKDKAKALFYYVATQIRYVGLEYGQSNRRPHQASEVYKNQYGDCKDKTTLLVSMLREAGIEAYPALVATIFAGRAWEDAPQVSAFDHVITLGLIDNQWVWMDPTAETSSFEDIPAAIQDRDALVIFNDGYQLTKIPVMAPEKNMDQEIMDIQIAEDSSATIFSTTTAVGINAASSRAYLKSLDPIYRKQYLEGIIAARATGGKLKDFKISDLDDLSQPYKLELAYTAPDYIEWANGIGLFKASVLAADKTAIIDGRKYPVFLGNTSIGESFVHITLPQNIKVYYLPPPVTLEIPQIRYTSEYTLSGCTITYHLRYETRDISIPLKDYDKYAEFQEKVNKELQRKIIVERKDK